MSYCLTLLFNSWSKWDIFHRSSLMLNWRSIWLILISKPTIRVQKTKNAEMCPQIQVPQIVLRGEKKCRMTGAYQNPQANAQSRRKQLKVPLSVTAIFLVRRLPSAPPVSLIPCQGDLEFDTAPAPQSRWSGAQGGPGVSAGQDIRSVIAARL